MSFWDFARGPASVRLMLEFAQEKGLAEAPMLARSRLAPAQLADPNTELSALQELRVAENLIRGLGHPPGLGLELGLRYRFTTFGLWGYGLVCSATVQEALDRALRFVQLTYAFSIIEVEPVDDRLVLRFLPPALPAGLGRFLVERDMAAAAALMAELGGPRFTLCSFELARGRGRAFRAAPSARALFGVTPVQDADGYALSFPLDWLGHRLPNANPTSAAMCDAMCAQLVERRRARVGTATLVQQYLQATASSTRPSQGSLAGLASTSERTLRRRLQGEGTSFRTLMARTQAEAAAELVRDESLSIGAIGARLGYADLSSFSQAFKRWHGVSPVAYRRGRA
jgi:AraC-like DNA-binding protein